VLKYFRSFFGKKDKQITEISWFFIKWRDNERKKRDYAKNKSLLIIVDWGRVTRKELIQFLNLNIITFLIILCEYKISLII